MSRIINVAAAQLGPIQRSDTRRDVVERLLAHLRQAHAMGCQLVVFPEPALTTFFPRWYMEDPAEIDAFYESEMPGPQTRVLFETARKLGISRSEVRARLQRLGQVPGEAAPPSFPSSPEIP